MVPTSRSEYWFPPGFGGLIHTSVLQHEVIPSHTNRVNISNTHPPPTVFRWWRNPPPRTLDQALALRRLRKRHSAECGARGASKQGLSRSALEGEVRIRENCCAFFLMAFGVKVSLLVLKGGFQESVREIFLLLRSPDFIFGLEGLPKFENRSNQVGRFDRIFDRCQIWSLKRPSSGSWSNGHLLFGFLEKMAYIDETFGSNKLVALEGRKMWGTLGSSFQLWWPGMLVGFPDVNRG